MRLTRNDIFITGGVALGLFVLARSKPKATPTSVPDDLQPNYDPAQPNELDGFGDITWVGDYGYFQGGYIDPSGAVIYTGQVEELPWYLSWGAGWLF